MLWTERPKIQEWFNSSVIVQRQHSTSRKHFLNTHNGKRGILQKWQGAAFLLFETGTLQLIISYNLKLTDNSSTRTVSREVCWIYGLSVFWGRFVGWGFVVDFLWSLFGVWFVCFCFVSKSEQFYLWFILSFPLERCL